MAMLSRQQLENMGFAKIGENVLVSDKSSFYNICNITLGSHVRIDDFCVFSAGLGGIKIGDYVHVASGCSLLGQGKITLSNFSGISSRVSIYSSNDDYSGASMTNPMVPQEFTDVKHADVFIGRHVIVGSGSILLPGVSLEDGVAIGAFTLVNRDCKAYGIYAGQPAKRIRERKKNMLDLEQILYSRVKHTADDQMQPVI
jgi:dTDP-4-amino-4,6-dideoxy-D-glucose acyltransferase